MAVHYEWDVETQAALETEANEAGEVLDHNHCKSYSEAMRAASKQPGQPGEQFVIVLVRDDDDRRAWAYVEDGKLPEWFHDADGNDYAKVPQRFVQEVARAR